MTREMRVDGFFDLETSDWDKFAAGGLYLPDKGFSYSLDSDDFFDTLMRVGGNLWAWNGGLFDFLWFLDQVRDRGYRARLSCAGTRITRIEIGHLVLRDAVALIPSSLAKAAEMAGMELTKETGLPCICDEDCGGYCSITPNCAGMSEPHIKSLIDYLEKDCVAGYEVITALFTHAEKNGYVLRGTIGGSAWATAKESLQLEGATWENGMEYHAARAGYYGGRVTVGAVSAAAGYRYDINSAYPAALSKLALPTGDKQRMAGSAASRAFERGKEGIYRAKVTIPLDAHLPPLPRRTPKGRVAYPIGSVIGSWSGYELRYAVSVGAKIERIVDGLVWSESEVVFKSLMEQIFTERVRVGKNTALGKWQKLFANSLTGKFAQAPDSERVEVNPKGEPVLCKGGACDGRCRANHCCDHRCIGRCRRWRQIDLIGAIWGIPIWSLPDCGYVHWAAYLTSWARVKWHQMASMFGTDFLYGDTDSVFAAREAPPVADVGPNLGQFSYDGRLFDYECLGPKAYSYSDEKGSKHAKLKGVTVVNSGDWQRFADGVVVVNERGVYGLRTAAKKGGSLFQRRTLKRSDKSDGVWYGDRRKDRNSIITRPVTFAEQLRRE